MPLRRYPPAVEGALQPFRRYPPPRFGEWISVVLAADVSDVTGALVDSGLAFAVESSRTYDVEAHLKWTTALATTGLQWCFTDPAVIGVGGLSSQLIEVPTSINARALRNDQLGAVVVGTGVTSAAIPHSAIGRCWVRTGTGASGSLKVQFQTEVAASQVTLLRGSELRYRVIS